MWRCDAALTTSATFCSVRAPTGCARRAAGAIIALLPRNPPDNAAAPEEDAEAPTPLQPGAPASRNAARRAAGSWNADENISRRCTRGAAAGPECDGACGPAAFADASPAPPCERGAAAGAAVDGAVDRGTAGRGEDVLAVEFGVVAGRRLRAEP